MPPSWLTYASLWLRSLQQRIASRWHLLTLNTAWHVQGWLTQRYGESPLLQIQQNKGRRTLRTATGFREETDAEMRRRLRDYRYFSACATWSSGESVFIIRADSPEEAAEELIKFNAHATEQARAEDPDRSYAFFPVEEGTTNVSIYPLQWRFDDTDPFSVLPVSGTDIIQHISLVYVKDMNTEDITVFLVCAGDAKTALQIIRDRNDAAIRAGREPLFEPNVPYEFIAERPVVEDALSDVIRTPAVLAIDRKRFLTLKRHVEMLQTENRRVTTEDTNRDGSESVVIPLFGGSKLKPMA